MDLWLIFLTGLTVGGLTCLAVQGGLLASTIAVREEEDLQEGSRRKHNILPTLAFLTTKFTAYVILGFILGAFGSALAISDNARIVMQLLAGAYMMVVALDLLNVHPIFRYAILQPPRFLTRMVKDTSRNKDLFAPAILGGLTIFIPCGTTLAMEAFAISSGSPILGAAIMGVFTLGTSPLFLGLGFLTTVLGDTFRTRFFKIAGALVMYLGIITFNSSLVLAGSPITLQTIRESVPIYIDLSGGAYASEDPNVRVENGVQVADITVYPTSYTPNRVQVKAGVPVRLNLTPTGGFGCTAAFRIPQLGISKTLAQNQTTPVEFTPTSAGKLTWTCSMGMYYGVIEVI
ncbi:sulfite exporter TauE/SafE family protein [Candidatus Microgenomates bacterium]|nr:sulfite exporter TauE/SafE family protein [Candidatus Microgenomates bacterium]